MGVAFLGATWAVCLLLLSPRRASLSPGSAANPRGASSWTKADDLLRPNDFLRVDFDRHIKLEFHGSTVTSGAGLLAYRELDDALRLTSTAASGLLDTRAGQNTQHGLLAPLRQSLYSRLAGYEDVNDAERLCLDPALRMVGVAGPRTK